MTSQNPSSSDRTQLQARRFRAGDDEALGLLYERVAPALHAWAQLRIAPHLRGRLDPGDVVQEVWLRAREKRDKFNPDSMSFRAWVHAIAKNILLESLRGMRRADAPKGTADGSSGQRLAAEIPADVTSISQRAAGGEALQRFVARVRTLPEDEQMLVVHCGLEGETCERAAVRLGLSKDAAIKRWQRLKKKLIDLGIPDELFAEEE